jgi:hypothetical protein
MKIVNISVENGETKVETAGFSGPECVAATQQIEQELLGSDRSMTRTSEFFKKAIKPIERTRQNER